jgi:hypothetical protein
VISIGIARYLESLNLLEFDEAGVHGDTFVESMPSSPDQAVMVIDQPGPGSDSELGYDSPGFQVIVRGTSDPRVSFDRAREIYDALHGLGPVNLPDGTRLLSCVAMQSHPVPIGQDSNNRFEHTLNFQTEVRALTAHRV